MHEYICFLSTLLQLRKLKIREVKVIVRAVRLQSPCSIRSNTSQNKFSSQNENVLHIFSKNLRILVDNLHNIVSQNWWFFFPPFLKIY